MITQPISHIRTLVALLMACAVAVFFAQPAVAQTAGKLKCSGCVKSKQLKNNGVKGKDIKDGQVGGADLQPGISIGTGSDDGDLSVKSAAGTATVSLDGDSGNVTNSLSGDGVVKAWARINPDGTVASCYRCNGSAAETRNIAPGFYEVDFTPLSTDIRSRPRTISGDGHGNALVPVASVLDQFGFPAPTDADTSSVLVITSSFGAPTTPANQSFTVVIY